MALLIFWVVTDHASSIQTRDPRREANLLKEKLLKEKIKKMRKSSTVSMHDDANAS